jgi:hypothetical protein
VGSAAVNSLGLQTPLVRVVAVVADAVVTPIVAVLFPAELVTVVLLVHLMFSHNHPPVCIIFAFQTYFNLFRMEVFIKPITENVRPYVEKG